MVERTLTLAAVLVVCSFFCPEAQAVDWTIYSENSDFRFYYEAEGMTHPSGDTIRVWVLKRCKQEAARDHLRTWGKKRGAAGYERLDYSMEQDEIDCTERNFRRLAVLGYDSDHTLLYSAKEEPEREAIEPYSNMEMLYQAVCEERARRFPSWRNSGGPRWTWRERRDHMPYVNLKLIGTLSKEQKSTIVREFSETLERVAGKPSEHTYIVIEEVARENWAKGGKLFSEM